MGNATFDETALRISPSPPPSTGSNSATSAIEHKYLVRVRILHYIRLAITIILIGLSTAVIACEGHALHAYNATHLPSKWWLPLWPQQLDLRPTITLLVGAAVVLASSLCYLLLAIIPSPHSRTTLLNLSYTALTLISLISSLLTLAYTTHINHHDDSTSTSTTSYPRYTIHTWTCLWAPGISAEEIISSLSGASTSPTSTATLFNALDGIPAPSGFGRLCTETHAAWVMVITMVVLEGVTLLGAGGIGWWLGWGVNRQRARSIGWGRKVGVERHIVNEEGWDMQRPGEAEGDGYAREVYHK